MSTTENRLDQSLVSIPLLLWRRRGLIAAVTAAVVLVGLAYALTATRKYASTAKLDVQQSGPQGAGERRADPPMDAEQYAAAQADLIESMPVFDDAARHLQDLPSLGGIDELAKHLQGRSWADVDKKSRLIDVTCQAADPTDAATIVNQVVASYIDYKKQQRRETSGKLLAALEADRRAVSAELADRTAELGKLQDEYGVMTLGDDYTTVATDQLKKMSAALGEARLEAVSRTAAYEEAARSPGLDPQELARRTEARGPEGFSASMTSEDSKDRLQLIAGLQLRLENAERTSGSQHPSVAAARATLRQAVAGYVASLKQAATTAVAKQRALEEIVDAQQLKANKLTTKGVEFVRLRGEIRRLEKLNDANSDRINEVKVDGTTGDLVTVVEGGRPDPKPVSPNVLRLLAMCVAAGLTLGAGSAFLLEWHDPRVRSPEQVESLVNAPVLGAIPRGLAGDAASHYRAVFLDPAGIAAESYRMVRTALLTHHRGQFKSLAVTSSSPREGKSTVASNLAIALAQAGRRVLLVDADMRSPTQHVALRLTGQRGLSDVLRGGVEWRDAVHAGDPLSPDFLPAGPRPSDPAELLGPERFDALLGELGGSYDHVIFDTPPVSCVADARLVASRCDLSLFVIRAERTNLKTCLKSFQALEIVGARMAGVIINDVASGSARSYGTVDPYYANRALPAPRRARLIS